MPPRTLLSAISFGAFDTIAHAFSRLLGQRAHAKVDTAQWTPELLKQLEWRRFEQLCAAYFEALGFRTDVALSGAGGVDINLYAQGAENASVVVRCQPWNAYRVGIKPVRGLVGAMASGNVAEGVLVTSGKFTQEARDFVRKEKKKISLVDGAELLAKISALVPEKALELLRFATQGDFLTPTCPTCALKMIPRKSTTHGRKFWGCRNYPGCKQTFFNKL